MTTPNEIYFDAQCYVDEDGTTNTYTRWEDITEVARVLVKNGYIMTLRGEDFDGIVLSFESANRELGAPYPFWLSPEEKEALNTYYDEEDDTEL